MWACRSDEESMACQRSFHIPSLSSPLVLYRIIPKKKNFVKIKKKFFSSKFPRKEKWVKKKKDSVLTELVGEAPWFSLQWPSFSGHRRYYGGFEATRRWPRTFTASSRIGGCELCETWVRNGKRLLPRVSILKLGFHYFYFQGVGVF